MDVPSAVGASHVHVRSILCELEVADGAIEGVLLLLQLVLDQIGLRVGQRTLGCHLVTAREA